MAETLFTHLKKEHKEVKGILKQLEKTEDGDTEERETLFTKLCEGLEPHMKAEEDLLYSRLESEEDTKEDALEAEEEHHAARLLLEELREMSKDDEHWKPKLLVLKEMVEHHIKEEESNLFGETREALDAVELKSLLKQIKREEEEIRSQMPGV